VTNDAAPDSPFDPTAPLPAPPEPWAGSTMPSRRDGPPYHMTDMIAAEPYLAERLLTRLAAPDAAAATLAGEIRAAVEAGRPIIVTGCGTSEHAALGVADIVRDALGIGEPGGAARAGAIVTVQAFELSLQPPADGLVIGVSHEGGTAATNAALGAARATGARTALITAAAGSPGAALADVVVATGEMDQSWCHTVGYLSPLLAAAAIAAHLSGRPLDAEAIRDRLAAGARDEHGAERIAATLADASTLLVLGSGADRTAGRELVLKVEEASWLPSAYRDLETFLHGHLPAAGPSTGLVAILTDPRGRAERTNRLRQALSAARELGVRSSGILSTAVSVAIPAHLTPAGRLLVDETEDLPPSVAALTGSATPLQLLTERLARARGTNPDPIRRDDRRYWAASEAADS
jgi:glucosamine--fructose-6-phosphate aminotransferase (isomerizing)